MRPSHRAKVARAVLQALDAIKSSDEVDLVFECFGLPLPERSGYGQRVEVSALATCGDDVLMELAEHLDIELPAVAAFPGPSCWKSPELRIFISHLSTKKSIAHSVADQLALFGASAFVAHDDIEPSDEWAREIQSALRSCDAMVAVMSDGFHDSIWCDQEIGAAIGRMVPLVSLYYESPPKGFAGLIQGIEVTGKKTLPVVSQIMSRLVKHPSTAGSASRALSVAMRSSTSWRQSNEISKILAGVTRLDSTSARNLQEALEHNGEVSGSFEAPKVIPEILERFGYPRDAKTEQEPAIDHDDIPF